MPTLRVTHIVQEYKTLSSTGVLGETATTADFALFDGLTTTPAEEQHQRGVARACDHDGDNHQTNDNMNDSTLSGSLLEEALGMLRAGRETQRLSSSEPANTVFRADVPSQIVCGDATSQHHQGTPTNLRSAATANQEECVQPAVSHESASVDSDGGGGMGDGDDEYSCRSFDMPPPRVHSMRHPDSGKDASAQAGPNELAYREKYSEFVARQIQNSSHALRDYRTMSSADKEREQERVLALLHRLGIRPLDGGPEKDCEEGDAVDNSEVGMRSEGHKVRLGQNVRHDRVSILRESTKKLPVTSRASERQLSVDPELANAVHDKLQISDRSSTRKSVSFALGNDESLVLLPEFESDGHGSDNSALGRGPSTPRRASGEQSAPPLHQDSSLDDDESFLSSDGEIEVARSKHHNMPGHASYNSPTVTTPKAEFHRKRTATTSGKRGTDTSRTRSSDLPTSYGLPVAASDQSKPFVLSTSPISPYQRHHHERTSGNESPSRYMSNAEHESCDHQDVSLGDSSPNDSSGQAKLATVDDDSILLTSSPSFIGGRQPLREASNQFDVRVKDGASFHLQPLETRPTRHEYFPDPFHVYDGNKLLPRMLRVLSKLCRREASAALKPNSTARAIVLSMDMSHIHQLLLKLVLEASCIPSDSPRPPRRGETLIVARERDQLEAWGRTFREGSSVRVLNHSTLPVVQRKTRSTAELCCKFDVVLTTYDCLKSADVTVNIDANGHVLMNDSSHAGEWVSSRTTPSQVEGMDCRQLSVLHCLCWKRVVFIDTVGRKSFLCKAETGRAFASRSLNSRSRFMFFTDISPDTDSMGALASLVKSDRKAVESIAAILRAEVDGSESDFLRHVVIDLNRRTTKHRRSRSNI